MNNTPIYDYEDAITFISERCSYGKNTINEILSLEEEYMRNVGIIE